MLSSSLDVVVFSHWLLDMDSRGELIREFEETRTLHRGFWSLTFHTLFIGVLWTFNIDLSIFFLSFFLPYPCIVQHAKACLQRLVKRSLVHWRHHPGKMSLLTDLGELVLMGQGCCKARTSHACVFVFLSDPLPCCDPAKEAIDGC